MSADDVQRRLEAAGLALKSKKRNGNDTGYQLRFTTGEIVNVFAKPCPGKCAAEKGRLTEHSENRDDEQTRAKKNSANYS
jgi:hypothetical protein